MSPTCLDCQIPIEVIPENYRKKWNGKPICWPCFGIRLARLSALVPVESGHWMKMDAAIDYYKRRF